MLLLFLHAVLALGCGQSPTGGGLALVGVTVIDGLGNPPVPGRAILVRAGRIAEIAAVEGYEPPRGAKVIDLPGRLVMLGLIDLHAHVTILPVDEGGVMAGEMHLEDSESVLRTRFHA